MKLYSVPVMENRSASTSFNSSMNSIGNGSSPVEEKPRKGSLQMLLPKGLQSFNASLELLPNLNSLHSPLSSPGEGFADDSSVFKQPDTPNTAKSDISKSSLVESPQSKIAKRESYKAQRKNYRREKKRVAKELLSTLRDPSIIVLADWLKVRGTLKSWTKLWCVLKPGLLLLYKSPKTHKSSHWVGTVLLNTCEMIERPSKKDGFCFKVFHPLEQSIWASRGPSGETIGAVIQPFPTAYLIFRAPSEAAGKCWMDALELALRCSSLLMRSMVNKSSDNTLLLPNQPTPCDTPTTPSFLETRPHVQWNESDYERHFNDQDLDDDVHTDENKDGDQDGIHSLKSSDSDSESHDKTVKDCDLNTQPIETPYIENGTEEFGVVGDAGQTEEVADENKSLIWTLVKQVRPGMDLSKVVLPTFILEPRSFLDKLTDYYYHADILSTAVLEDDAFTRMKLVVQWYLSGFYKKPKGLKKPYNPILGETFRCYWKHPKTNSRTFYLAEQVSHHPPVSAFYVTNRKDGFCIRGSILAKSKYYGNSLSAILDGKGRLTFLTRGEDYIITMPYAHCKGILVGTLTMELGGKIQIDCEKTGYKTEIEFKLKPFLGGSELANMISGKIKLGKETLTLLEGHWDQAIYAIDKRTGEKQLLWNPVSEVRAHRLKRYTVPIENQGEFESERLWMNVTSAIFQGNQVLATEEKTILEEAQRQAVKERKVKCVEWIPRYFEQDLIHGEWVYKHADSRPWDPRNDVLQYECDFMIRTKTRHRTPIIRTSSIVSVDDQMSDRMLSRSQRLTKQASLSHRVHTHEDSESSTAEIEGVHASDSSDSETIPTKPSAETLDSRAMQQILQPLESMQKKQSERLDQLHQHIILLVKEQRTFQQNYRRTDMIYLSILFLMQMLIMWIFK